VKRLIFSIVLLIGGTLLFQSFQCASPEMTTAKLKYRNQLWAEAEDALSRELTKNPNNGEALYLMADTKLRLEKLEEAADYCLKADKAELDQKYRFLLANLKFNIWSTAYNQGISSYNKYYDEKDAKYINEAIQKFDIAIKIRPTVSEFYRLKGLAYEQINETEKAVENYLKYETTLNNDLVWAKGTGVHLFMPREKVIAKIGKPVSSVPNIRGNDSILIDNYKVMGSQLYVFYSFNKDKQEMQVEGWKVAPPPDMMDNEITSFSMIDYGPFGSLAEYYYQKALDITKDNAIDSVQKTNMIEENLEKSKKYIKYITTLDPSNIDANRFLINIYDVQGKSEDALKEAENLVKTEPNNKFYLAQYGDILFRLEKYDESIKQFEKVLEIDPDFCDASRNLAAAYKNKAAIIQKEQQDRHDRDKNYKENPNEYLPLLNKSAEYFEKCRSCKQYKNDLLVLSELADLYYFLNNNDKLNNIVDALERLEHLIGDNQKADYWLKMCKIYGSIKSPKREEACDKANKYLESEN